MGQQRKNIGRTGCYWNALHRRDRLLILAGLLIDRGQRQVGIAIMRRSLHYGLISCDRLRSFSLRLGQSSETALRPEAGRVNFKHTMEKRLRLCIALLAYTEVAHQLKCPDFVWMRRQDVPKLLLSDGQLIVADELGNSRSSRDFTDDN